MWRRVALVLVLCQVLAGCSLGGSHAVYSAQDASPAKLNLLRESFTTLRPFHEVSSIAVLGLNQLRRLGASWSSGSRA
jgi:hypothetical protein